MGVAYKERSLLLLLFLNVQFCILKKEKHAQYILLILFIEISGPEESRSDNFLPFFLNSHVAPVVHIITKEWPYSFPFHTSRRIKTY